MKHHALRAYYVFSPFTRLFHWMMVVCMVVLVVTGLYIGNPFFIGTQGIEPTYAISRLFSMESMRYNHFVAAYLLLAASILRIYGWLVNKGDRLLPRFWTHHFWEGARDTSLHYMFLRPQHRPYLRNSLARMSYLGLYILVVVEVITGFAMYTMINPHSVAARVFGAFNDYLVNEYTVHLIHHYVAWFIVFFTIGHLYMATRADWMEKGGEVSGMISGVKYYDAEPEDLSDIE